MSKRTVLTGITTTGTPHLGNYVGAIKPAIQASHGEGIQSCYFLADYHALIKCRDPGVVHQSTLEIAATWLALGLEKGEDADFAIAMGLFSYPVLMAADILMFNAHDVPVGRDQVQHLEMARDIAQRFNHFFGEHFVLPEAVIDDNVAVLPGQDGRKMSKSYNNTIPLWLPEKKLRKSIMRIVTNSLEPGEPKQTEDSALFAIYSAFASVAQREEMERAFRDGIAWGAAKQQCFELINSELSEARLIYEELISNPSRIEIQLQRGAERAREIAVPFMKQLRSAVGIRPLADKG
jgi:tryptophanyl-tRNA synthetase